ncbi:serine hydrolase domain-containing protein [Cryptosporangium arvum]|uniref:Penicillin-binding protein, beta-lactamase class C n=1 Tax=Cryptosporangium arvum DSM 44712 TaxID=927661 RepID=A0A010ZTJ2_9ACTN|nr:serine hydrolase domain-containing protein [Cryptosporangium arvum]EXG80542.1 penicillin-binding protein, beta-lactamase class C [Cryptosporangium arvum DSM 44712]
MRLLLLVLVLLVVGAGPAAAAASDPTDDYMRRYQSEHRLPGLAFAVVRGDEVVHSRTWGTDGDGDAVTADTPFLLGSVSKPFTALAVMQLVESGRVDLDAPVRTYLPEFPAGISVRQLLTHTSGLAQWALRTDRFGSDADELGRAVRELEPGHAPGEHEYSDANYLAAAAVVEAVTGRSFGDHLHTAVLDPLAMDHAVATTADAVSLPAGHRLYFGHPRRFDPAYDPSGVAYGYLGADLGDVTHFVTAQLRGGRYGSTQLLSPAGIALTQKGVADFGAGRYGLGWRESELDGDRIAWHAGATPGYFSHVVLVPGSDLGVVVLANAYSPTVDGELAAAAFDLARIAAGATPTGSDPDPLFAAATIAPLVVAFVLVVLLAWSLRPHRPRRRSVVRLIAWLLPCGALVAIAAWGFPAAMGVDLSQTRLWTPDIGLALVAVIVLAGALAVARVVRFGIPARPDNARPTADVLGG